MKQILALTFASAALLLSSCAHTKSCCSDTKSKACCATDKKAKTDDCKSCETGAKPGAAAKTDAHKH